MQNLIQVESVREIQSYPRQAEGLYVLTGDLLNELRQELEKGHRARWLLEEIVALGRSSE